MSGNGYVGCDRAAPCLIEGAAFASSILWDRPGLLRGGRRTRLHDARCLDESRFGWRSISAAPPSGFQHSMLTVKSLATPRGGSVEAGIVRARFDPSGP